MQLSMRSTDIRFFACSPWRQARFFFILLVLAHVPVIAEASASGSDVTVPDIETRIRNSGSSIPEQALPELVAPAPVSIPAIGDRSPAFDQNPVTTTENSPSPTTPKSKENPLVGDVANIVPAMSGAASIDAGLPGAVSAGFSFTRTAPDFPSVAIGFSHDAADGYSEESAGAGYFDRMTKFSVAISREVPDSVGRGVSPFGWFVDTSFVDRAYGFQGQSSRYFDLARRDAAWAIGVRSISIGSSPFAFSVTGDGSVYSSYGEGEVSGSSMASSSVPPISPDSTLTDATGYYLSPLVAVSFAHENFSAELSGRYGYETAGSLDELHAGEGSLALGYAMSGARLSASVGLAGDSEDRVVIPFSLGLTWGAADSKAISDSVISFAGISLREFHLSGGIDRNRISFYSLSWIEPLADYRGLSVYAADWNAKVGFTLAPVGMSGLGSALSPLTFDANAEYRRSLPGHGTLVLTDELDSSALVAVERVERSSFVTRSDVRWNGDGFTAKTGWSGEWLDRLHRESLQALTCGFEAFDRAKEKKWKVGVDASFALDRAAVPSLSASGFVYPVKNLSLGLSLDDAISLATGKARERNGLYMERSGTLKLSAGVYF